MNRSLLLDNPLLLGFEHARALMERAARAGADAYPPYNVEDLGEDRIRLTLAVAGFRSGDLSIVVGENELTIAGRRENDSQSESRDFIHRGVAARSFSRVFILADGLQVGGARLEDGLLHIEAERRAPPIETRSIPIQSAG